MPYVLYPPLRYPSSQACSLKITILAATIQPHGDGLQANERISMLMIKKKTFNIASACKREMSVIRHSSGQHHGKSLKQIVAGKLLL